MRDLDYVRSEPVGVRHLCDGLAVPQPSASALRVRRYILLQGCQEVVYPYWRERIDKQTGEIQQKSEFRVSVCGRTAVGDEVQVYRVGESVGYGGLMRCGNVWGCVVCCAKIMRKRGEQIAALFDGVHRLGGAALMVTFTAAHQLVDPLETLLEQFKTAQRRMTQSRAFRDLMSESDRAGSVVVTEIKWSARNGWHPHQHQAWFFRWQPGPDPDQLASSLFPIWRVCCAKVGLETAEFYRGRRVGVDVRRAWDASEYLVKFDREREWSLSAEMTAGRLKTGGGQSLTPWSILEDAVIRGRGSDAETLWIEYLRASRGKACVSLKGARDLLKQLDLPTTLDDWADANEAGDGEVLGTLSSAAFDKVVRQGGLGRLLEAARSEGLVGLDRELQSISI